jgi:5-methylcytosine-specific restriction endonuclease McrA
MSVRIRPPWPGDAVNNSSGWIQMSTPQRRKDGIEKVCRLCARPGLPDNRFSWHPRCGKLSGASSFLYAGLIWTLRRQQGLCAMCPKVLAKWKPYTSGELKGYWQITGAAELDHVVPLWRVDLMPKARRTVRWWLPGNLQTLCRPCHKEKTAREAKERGMWKRDMPPI